MLYSRNNVRAPVAIYKTDKKYELGSKLAAPILDVHNRPVAAISIAGPNVRFNSAHVGAAKKTWGRRFRVPGDPVFGRPNLYGHPVCVYLPQSNVCCH